MNSTVVADRGYFKGEEILACDEAGITTYLPKPQTSGSLSKGLFSKRDFIYRPADDEYECPAGERLIYRFSRRRERSSDPSLLEFSVSPVSDQISVHTE